MDLKRREFLKSSLAGLSGAAMGANVASASASSLAAEAEKKPKNPFFFFSLARVKLFGDVETSRIGMGTGIA